MDGRAIKALEVLQPTMEKMEEQIISDVNRLIADGKLTPELALQKWYQLNAIRTLPRKAKSAVSANRRG